MRFNPYDKITFFLTFLVLVFAGVMAFVQKKIQTPVRQVLFCIPLLVCVVHFFINRYKGCEYMTVVMYAGLYMSAAVIAIWGFSSKTVIMRNVSLGFCVFSVLYFLIVPASLKPHTGNYSKCSYTESFEKIICQMEKDYVLSSWKDVDYEKIKADLMPMFFEAESNNDGVLYCEALLRYIYALNDGHIVLNCFNTKGREYLDKAVEKLAGNDFGFSMIKLSTGEIIAILVDENSEAYDAGIRFGTVIKKWNGVPVDEASEQVECVYDSKTIHSFPVKANEDMLKPVFLAGKSGEKLEVVFTDDNGKDTLAVLNVRGGYNSRLKKALKLFYHTQTNDFENLYTKKLNDKCGYMIVNSASMSSTNAMIAQMTGEYGMLVDRITKKIEELGDIEEIILDLRNNSGGFDVFSMALTSVFTDEEFFGYSDGKVKNGEFKVLDRHFIKGNGRFKNLRVGVLVNSECRSAGDSLTDFLSRLPNVTVYGITGNNCIDQNPGGLCVSANGYFGIRYPIGPVLDENNNPRIDTKADRIATVDMDHRIALDYEAARVIFEELGDYELNYVMKSECHH